MLAAPGKVNGRPAAVGGGCAVGGGPWSPLPAAGAPRACWVHLAVERQPAPGAPPTAHTALRQSVQPAPRAGSLLLAPRSPHPPPCRSRSRAPAAHLTPGARMPPPRPPVPGRQDAPPPRPSPAVAVGDGCGRSGLSARTLSPRSPAAPGHCGTELAPRWGGPLELRGHGRRSVSRVPPSTGLAEPPHSPGCCLLGPEPSLRGAGWGRSGRSPPGGWAGPSLRAVLPSRPPRAGLLRESGGRAGAGGLRSAPSCPPATAPPGAAVAPVGLAACWELSRGSLAPWWSRAVPRGCRAWTCVHGGRGRLCRAGCWVWAAGLRGAPGTVVAGLT